MECSPARRRRPSGLLRILVTAQFALATFSAFGDEAHLIEYAKTRTVPALSGSLIDPAISRVILSDRKLLRWCALQPVTDLGDASIFSTALLKRLPYRVRSLPGARNFTSRFLDGFVGSPEVRSLFAAVSSEQRTIAAISLTEGPVERSRWARAGDYLATKIYDVLLPLGKLFRVKNAENLQFEEPKDFAQRIVPDAPDSEIIVYRGTSAEAIDAVGIDFFRRNGFVSRTALGEGMQNSFAELAERGMKSAAVNHVLGTWKWKTPLISTTLDKSIALGAAGTNGYVFTIRIRRGNGMFLNDPIIWEGTPWERTGNPFANAEEFAVFHQIPPAAIETVERVAGPAPNSRMQAVSGYKTLLTSIPWIVWERCVSLFLAKGAATGPAK